MKTRKSVVILFVVVMLAASCIPTINIGKKPILTMEDVKQLKPVDLADFAINLYNKRADWYRARMRQDVTTMSKEEKKLLVKEYSLLTKSWAIINSYDLMVSGGQVDADLQIQIYAFIKNYLGGVI